MTRDVREEQVRHVLAAHLMITADPATACDSRRLLPPTVREHHGHRPRNGVRLGRVNDEFASAGRALRPGRGRTPSKTLTVECGLGPPIGSGLGGYAASSRLFPEHTILVGFTDGVVEVRGQTIDESLRELLRCDIDACIEQAQHDTPLPPSSTRSQECWSIG